MEQSGAAPPPRGRQRTVALLLSTLMLAAGLVPLTVFFLAPVRNSWKARRWDPASCTIVNARVVSSGESGSYIEVTYRYRRGDVGYTGTRANFDVGGSSAHEDSQRVVDRLVPGRSVPCWVDPRQPDQSVLDRRITGDTWLSSVAGIFVLFGALGLYGTFWGTPAWLVRAAAAGEAAAAAAARRAD